MSLDELAKALKGGAGSGNFGHSGRPGIQGGSGGGTSGGGGGAGGAASKPLGAAPKIDVTKIKPDSAEWNQAASWLGKGLSEGRYAAKKKDYAKARDIFNQVSAQAAEWKFRGQAREAEQLAKDAELDGDL